MRFGVCLLLLSLSAVTASAETLDDPRALGMGGAVGSDPVANSAVLYNPAGMSRAYQYAMELMYFRGGALETNAGGINIVDSKTQPSMAVGVAYAYEFTDAGNPVDIKGHNARLAFSHAIVPNKAYLGVGLHYLHLNRDPGDDLKGFTLDAGGLFSITPAIHLGFFGNNLINLDDSMAPLRAGGGVAYTGEALAIDFDTVADFTTVPGETRPIFRGGAELLIADSVPVRAGVERNQAVERTYVTGGVGFLTSSEGGTGSQVNLGYRQATEDSKDFHFGVGLTFFM